MSRHPTAKDQETAGTLRALRRAARRARELGVRTNTPVYVIKKGRIVDLTKEVRAVQRGPAKQRETPRSK